uniref:TFIIS central domain-containing protein n=1 Tax=Davidia involucrata TaxID=16924 RepID=A0A5B7BQR9_DAVIN
MSNNLVSRQLSISNKEMGQLEPISNKLDSSISNMRMGMIGPMSNNAASQQFVMSDNQMGLVESMSNNIGSQTLPVLNKPIAQMEPNGSNLGSHQFLKPIQQVGEVEAMLNNLGSQKLLSPSNQREPMSNHSVPQQFSIGNKRTTQMEHFLNTPGLQQLSVPHKKTAQMQFMSRTSGLQNSPASNKRMVRNESISNKSGSQQPQTPKNRTARLEPSPKGQTESFESVRSKMRESLAAALAFASQLQDKAANEEKKSQSEAAITSQQTREDSQPAEFTSTPADAADHDSENPVDTLPSKESCSADRPNDGRSTSQETFSKEMGDSTQSWKCAGQDFQYNNVLPDEDVSFSDNFFVKDELLQGNGLTWALDLDVKVGETKEVQTSKKRKLEHEDTGRDEGEQPVQSPQSLAFKIEAELFKLFGGVNKKYKEKGRSLLFNLKDRNNPELIEKVMSGEISPERLCSMTAEELASKELSEWRMAKAEELAQMVVLPDSDVDIRRLVRKTHKGEFQVEVEQDDGVSVEVSVGTSSLSQIQLKNKETETPPPSKSDGGEKSSLENQDISCSLTIPSDGTDLMQGLIVDELKDAEFLPPIVSLDEFMESLDSEPPFENLPVETGKTIPQSNRESSDSDNKLVSSDLPSKDPVDTNPDRADKKNRADKMEVKYTELDMKVKSSGSPVEPKISPTVGASKVERVWEGELQLNISSTVTVVGCFRSGEKTSTKEWPSSLEIKGRVRLDAFEKFLQELPMSRSRAVMVVQFVLEEGSPENEQASLSEVVESYVVDERVGFAEPAPGVELYFCPLHTKILETLSKHLPKDHTKMLKSTDNGLIGVVVWRKVHLSSTVSPNSSSHHKHSSKNKHFTSRRQQERDTNVNVNFASRPHISSMGVPQTHPEPPPDDDDIPPGFGPGAARDEDDLPEFSFSGRSNPSVTQNHLQGSGMTPFHSHPQTPSRPVDHMRELVHKYGQTGTGAASGNWQAKRGVGAGSQPPWNDDDDDDDDDMPEWQPIAPQQQQLPPQLPRHSFQQPMMPHVANRHLGSAMPVQLAPAPVAVPMQQRQMQGAWWPQPPGPQGLQHSNLGSQPGGGQYYGVPAPPPPGRQLGGLDWRQDAPRSRGF